MNDDLRYPVGRFRPPSDFSAGDRAQWIDAIAQTPAKLRAAVTDLDDAQLDTRYRPDGWTVRQLVHHVADSHMNAYVRSCLALTEQEPTIRPYDEGAWAELPFARSGPIAVSLDLLTALHGRWVPLLQGVQPADFERPYRHPVSGRTTLHGLVALYAWHGQHHVAHITRLRAREGW
jgi:hypothetical protein